jgi:hypothetical protein
MGASFEEYGEAQSTAFPGKYEAFENGKEGVEICSKAGEGESIRLA